MLLLLTRKARFQRNLLKIRYSFIAFIVSMKTRIIIFLMLLIAGEETIAQPKFEQQYGSECDYKRLWYLNIQYIQSWVRSDTVTYNKLLWAEDFVHQSGANGYLYPKKEIMSIFGENRFDAIEYFYADNTIIKFITDTVAMIYSKPVYRGRDDKEESLSRYNDVYIKRNGNWVCVSASITAINNSSNKFLALKVIPQKINFVTLLEGNNEDIAEIKKLNGITREMLEKPAVKVLEELFDDEFMMINREGNLYSKKQLLKNFSSIAKQQQLPYTIENFALRFISSNVAMVHGAMVYKLDNGAISGVQFGDIYVKRGSKWKCVAVNNTPIKN